MATKAVRTNKLNNFNLLALVLEMNATRARCRRWARLTATQQFEVLNNGVMGNIGGNTAIGTR